MHSVAGNAGACARCALLLATLVALDAGAAPTVEQCVAASAAGQQQQKKGSLFAAKQQLETCSDPLCPTLVQSECTKWLADVLAAMPSIVVVARVDGVDQQQARVLLDGHLWLNELSGRPEDIEPGEHELTVTVGKQTQGQRLVVNVAEKNRLVVFSFASQLTEPIVTKPLPDVPGVAVAEPRGFPTLPVVLSTVGAAGVGLFIGFGLSGRAALERLEKNECAATKTCNPALVDDVRRRFLVADISLGVGVVGALLAGWQWWRWGTAPAVTVTPVPGGAGASISGAW